MPPSRAASGSTEAPPPPTEAALAFGTESQAQPENAAEFLRLAATQLRSRDQRSERGQFFTPWPIAKRMAGLFQKEHASVRILDPGAGTGSLTAALVTALLEREIPPTAIQTTTVESDPQLRSHLSSTIAACRSACDARRIAFSAAIVQDDFIRVAATQLQNQLSVAAPQYDCIILNPPYLKLSAASPERQILNDLHLPTPNLYAAFVGLSAMLLAPGGELVAITPRSFCNGPYFTPFRRFLLDRVTLTSLLLYTTRNRAFDEDKVLQENIILAGIKGRPQASATVAIRTSTDPTSGDDTILHVRYHDVIHENDPARVIRIVQDSMQRDISQHMTKLPATLRDLDLEVSTGRVVDFRARDFLRDDPEPGTVPLLYANHFDSGGISWPKQPSRKPNAIVQCPETASLLVPTDIYVLIKRFSTKEERRRLVAVVLNPSNLSSSMVGIENHINYVHQRGRGLPRDVARGLALFLNSTLVDEYFRQFNGHTQVNASDLRSLRYPSRAALAALGQRVTTLDLTQDAIDQLVEQEVFHMTPNAGNSPSQHKTRVEQAIAALKALGLPRQQQNERSALTLLALLNLKPQTPWAEAENPLRGITEMMEYFKAHYGKQYAPNTRETVRRQTVHQFLEAGICIQNPDVIRSVNSPQSVYQVPETLLPLFKAFNTPAWEALLRHHLLCVGTLTDKYARERDMKRIPIQLGADHSISLSPGEHNLLAKAILEEFCPRFTPNGTVLYVGDTEDKMAYCDTCALAALGISVDQHGKMPDVIIHHTEKNWLVLIEAVTSHGPVSPKRHAELANLFSKSTAGLVYVTAFATRKALGKYLGNISWETEVWVAESPSHLIHFNGERFLGPYEKQPPVSPS